MKKYSFAVISSIFLSIAPIIFSSILTWQIIVYEKQISQFGWQEWLIITLLCCITSTFAITPPTFLALIFGYFIAWNAILPIFLINLVAIFLVNFITKKLNQDKLLDYIADNKKANRIIENIRKEELKFIFFAKLSPILPFGLTNFVFALSGAKLKNILLGGFLGMIPRTLLAIWTGSQAKEIRRLLENPNEGNIQKTLLIVLLVISVVGIISFFLPKEKAL